MRGAGQRDQLVTFQRATISRDALGVETMGDWAALGSRWAQVFFGSGAERRNAGVEQATQAATFVVLADSVTMTITTQDRISHLGLSWDVTGIAQAGERRGQIEFTAVASRG